MAEAPVQKEVVEIPKLRCDNLVEFLDTIAPPNLGTIVIDSSGGDLSKGVASLSPKLRKILGYQEEESIDLGRIFPEKNKTTPKRFFDRFKKLATNWDTGVLCKDGSRLPVRVSNTELSSEGKNYVLLQLQDITKETKDALTGLFNRRSTREKLVEKVEEAKELAGIAKEAGEVSSDNYPLSVVFMDVDHFKRYNDDCEGGHEAGDRILKFIAGILLNEDIIGPNNFVGRWGGEEFVIVLPLADREHALEIIERIRKELTENTSHGVRTEKLKDSFGQIRGGDLVYVTATFGLYSLQDQIELRPDVLAKLTTDEITDDLIHTADTYMNIGKQNGRDLVVTAADDHAKHKTDIKFY